MVSKLLFKNVFQSQIKPEIEEVILGQVFFVVGGGLLVVFCGFCLLALFCFHNSDITYLFHSLLALTLKNPTI